MSIDWQQAAAVPIADVVLALGLEPPRQDGKTFCFSHPEDTPSLHVYDTQNRWWAYCCGVGGDTISLVAGVFGCSRWKAALWLLSSGLEPVTVESARPKLEDADLTDRVERESKRLTRADADDPKLVNFFERNWPYLTGKLSWVFGAFGLRIVRPNALWVPHLADGRYTGVKVRDLLTGKKFSVTGSSFRHLYRETLPPAVPRGDLILCEGESDTWCMSAWTHAYCDPIDVAGLPSGANYLPDPLVAELSGYRAIYLALDDDDAGRKAAERIRQTVKGPQFLTVKVPGGRVAEAFADGWEPEL